MFLIIFLSLVVIGALIGLSWLDKLDQKNRHERLKLRRLQNYSEEIQDLLSTLIETIPNDKIILAINEHLIEQLEEILSLPEAPVESTTLALNLAKERQTQWQEKIKPRFSRYARDSDAQIARTQLQLKAAMEFLPVLASKKKITAAELESFLSELRWAALMVSVMSFVAQGERALVISDRFSALAFFRKAQQLLMESLHPDPRRVKMIKEISEIIDGDRAKLSDEFKYQEQVAETEEAEED